MIFVSGILQSDALNKTCKKLKSVESLSLLCFLDHLVQLKDHTQTNKMCQQIIKSVIILCLIDKEQAVIAAQLLLGFLRSGKKCIILVKVLLLIS